ncbi:hypothetical protein BCR44DRAFT_1439602 [Catenaria anguillulae PL171]|uniref:Adenylate kinase n=1 Tax=Catenaria anguillulae PL171 TaxID=765915 RepID=A0A1Y2HGH2_9FUNG|nr:hypothetical protein BCR44DRAFT_1439602 [Catenaria anguillulae PL171]
MFLTISGPPLCGKSTLAAALAQRLNHHVLDPQNILERVALDPQHKSHVEVGRRLRNGSSIDLETTALVVNNEIGSSTSGIIELSYSNDMSSAYSSLIALVKSQPDLAVHISIDTQAAETRQRIGALLLDPLSGQLFDGSQITCKSTSAQPSSGAEDQAAEDPSGEPKELDEVDGDGDAASDDAGIDPHFLNSFAAPIQVEFPTRTMVDSHVFSRLVQAVILPFDQSFPSSRVEPEVKQIIPRALQVTLPGFAATETQIKLLRVFLECHGRWTPSITATPFESATFQEALDNKVELEDLQIRRSLSSWRTQCPVAYVEEKKLIDGSPQFGVSFKDHVYFASSAEHQHRLVATNSDPSSLASYAAQFFNAPHVDILASIQSMVDKPSADQNSVHRLSTAKLRSGHSISPELIVDLLKQLLPSPITNQASAWIVSNCPMSLEVHQVLENRGIAPKFAILVSAQEIGTNQPDYEIPCSLDEIERDSLRVLSDLDVTLQTVDTEYDGKAQFVKIEEQVNLEHTFALLREKIDPFAPQAAKFVGNTSTHLSTRFLSCAKAVISICQAHGQGKHFFCATEAAQNAFIANPNQFLGHEKEVLPPPRFFVCGPQGVGKTTIAETFQRLYGFTPLNFNDHLRDLRSTSKDFEEIPDSTIADLNAEVLDKVMRPLFLTAPYTSKGIVIEGFPRTRSEAEAAHKQGWIPDATITLSATHGVLVERLLKVALKDNPHIESLQREHADNNEDNPIETLKQDISAAVERELTDLDDIKSWLDEMSLPHCQIDSDRNQRIVLHKLFDQLTVPLMRRENLLKPFGTLSARDAELLLQAGIFSHSSYGRMCPIKSQQTGIPSFTAVGRYPAFSGDEVYWFSSEAYRNDFVVSRACIPKRVSRFVPMRIFVSGLRFDQVQAISVPLICEQVVQKSNDNTQQRILPSLVHDLAKRLRSGQALESSTLLAFVQHILEPFHPMGFVMENPDLEELMPDLALIMSQDDQAGAVTDLPDYLPFADVTRSIAKRKVDDLNNGYLSRWSHQFDCVRRVNAHLSGWALRHAVTKTVHQSIRQFLRFYAGIYQCQPAPAYQVGLSKSATPSGGAGSFCSVCLVEDCFRDVQSDWKYALLYHGSLWQFCSLQHQDQFKMHPEHYSNARQPAILPEHLPCELARKWFPDRFEASGYCPVMLNRKKVAVDGNVQHAYQLKGKYYALSSQDAATLFQESPHRYITWPPVPLPPRLTPQMLSQLPASQFLDFMVKQSIQSGLAMLSQHRPKLPFKTLDHSAILILALYFKASNMRFPKHIQDQWQRRLNVAIGQAMQVQSLKKQMLDPSVNKADPTVLSNISKFFQDAAWKK